MRTAVLAGCLLFVLAGIGGCGPERPPGSPGSTVEGVVIGVMSTGLTEVQGFTIRTASGESLEFRLGRLENATEFPPGHLAEHQATSAPVRVTFRLEGDERIAYRIEDAG